MFFLWEAWFDYSINLDFLHGSSLLTIDKEFASVTSMLWSVASTSVSSRIGSASCMGLYVESLDKYMAVTHSYWHAEMAMRSVHSPVNTWTMDIQELLYNCYIYYNYSRHLFDPITALDGCFTSRKKLSIKYNIKYCVNVRKYHLFVK